MPRREGGGQYDLFVACAENGFAGPSGVEEVVARGDENRIGENLTQALKILYP